MRDLEEPCVQYAWFFLYTALSIEILSQYTTAIVPEVCYTMTMKVIVYPDYILIVNGVVDYVILYMTGKLMHERLVWWRLLLASILGSAISLGIVMLNMVSAENGYMIRVMLAEILMLVLAYSVRSWKKMVLMCGCHILLAFMLHGLLEVLLRIVRADYLLILLLACLVLVLLTKGYLLYSREKQLEIFRYRGNLYWNDQAVSGGAFVDTGNTLVDPVSRLPVVIADGTWLLSVLPKEYKETVLYYIQNGVIDYGSIAEKKLYRACVIPYRTITESAGCLLGLRFSKLLLYQNEGLYTYSPVVIGVSRTPVSRGKAYQLLLPEKLLSDQGGYRENDADDQQ